VVIACLAFFSTIARGDDVAMQVANIRIGQDGAFKLGDWTAIEFDLTGPSGLEVTPVLRAVDPDGQGTFQPFAPVKVNPDNSPTRVRGLFQSGKLNASLQLQLLDQDHTLDTIPLRVGTGHPFHAYGQSTSFWLTVGEQNVFSRGVERLNTLQPNSARQIALTEFSHPIWNPAGLDSIDVITFNGDVAIDEETSRSLQQWVLRGGRLIVSVGNTVNQLAANPISTWLPIKPQGLGEVAKLTAIQDLVPRSSQLRTLTTVPAAVLDRTQGLVIASDLVGPLVMRTAYGAGQVTVVAVKLSDPPISTWDADSQGRLAGVLTGISTGGNLTEPSLPTTKSADFDPSAVTGLQSQLLHTLDHFDALPRTAPWTVIGWIALFAVVIGPLDYLLVTKGLRRPEWTWLTMPCWIALASSLAILRGNGMNEQPEVARQMDSVDIDLSSGTLRGQSWFNFYSNKTQRKKIDVQLNPAFLNADADSLRICWFPRPGEGYRGMSGSGGLSETRPQYRFFVNQQGIDNLPVQQWSSGAVSSQWEIPDSPKTFLTGELVEMGLNRLTGQIQHHLPGELTDWFLAYGNFAYFDRPPVGEKSQPLPAGKDWNLSTAGSNLLRGRLTNMIYEQNTGLQQKATDEQLQRTPYNPDSTVPLTWELMTSFYQAVGGEGYSHLTNESLQHLDLSETIQLKRAVLFGKLDLAPMTYQVDGKEMTLQKRSTMVRLIIPVVSQQRDSNAPPPQEILVPKK